MIIFTRNRYEKKAYNMEFYLKFNMDTIISSHPGTILTNFTRNSCGMKDITFIFTFQVLPKLLVQ